MPEPEGVQGTLAEAFDVVPDDVAPAKKTRIEAHERASKNKNKHLIDGNDDAALFFDKSKVPVKVIAVANDEATGLNPADFEVIGEKISYRLAQRPGSYVIFKYVRPVIKLRAAQTVSCRPAPMSVLDGCRADVSFIAGMIIDKFAYDQPLYRQHVKLQDSGINVSRAWITKLMPAAVSLLEPIFNAQLESVRRSRVIAMDETPIKAGRAGQGKMKAAYFWPVVGEQDEICFLYYPSRAAQHVETALALQRPNGAVLQSDGYSAYEHYAKKTGITHAQCWAQARRKTFDARDIEQAQADQALHAIATLYKVEQQIRDDGLAGQAKLARQQTQSKPVLERFFASIDESSTSRDSCRAAPALLRSRTSMSAGSACRCTWMTRRYRSTRTISSAPTRDPDGEEELAVQLDRTGRQARRHCAKPAGHLPAARHQSLRLLRGRAAESRPASGITRASSSRHGSGKRCLPTIRCGSTCTTLAAEVLLLPPDRLLGTVVEP